MNPGSRHLVQAARRASVLGALYGCTLGLLAWPRERSSVWRPTVGAGAEPAVLLGVQILAVAGLVALVFALRSVARALARGADPPEAARPVAPSGIPVASVVVLPLATVVAPAACIILAARGLLGPVGLIFGSLGIPALAWAAAPVPRGSNQLGGRTSTEALVRRLRGASLVVTVAGGAFFFVSGSLVLAALLPWAMLREVPNSAPPEQATLALARLESGPVPANSEHPNAPLPPISTPTSETRQHPLRTSAGGGGGSAPTEAASMALAGEAIHSLLFAGSPNGPGPLERTPVRVHEPWWQETMPRPLDLAPHEWAPRLAAALEERAPTAEERRFLQALADHPANREFDLLDGAMSADITGERLVDLWAHPVAAFEIPIPRYVEFWNGVRGRIAGAIWLARQGEAVEAQRRIRSAVRLGQLLLQDGPSTLDALMGSRVVEEARQAWSSLEGVPGPAPAERRSGPPGESASESRRRASQAGDGEPEMGEVLALHGRWLEAHAAALDDPSRPRGVRLEAFAVVQSFRPCRSVSSVLWGDATWSDAWSRSRQEALAVRPSEASLAGVLAHGWLGTRAGIDGWGWLPRILAVGLSDRPAVTHCAPLAATLLSRG